VRAVKTLQKRLNYVSQKIDKRWWTSIWDAVDALFSGRTLQLTRLGRHSKRRTTQKHRIKALDRLLGSKRVQSKTIDFYRALAGVLCGKAKEITVLVDWTQVRGDRYALVGAIPIGGRAIPILSHVHKKAARPTRKMHKEFLNALSLVLPEGCRPILITDAGFQGTWARDVANQGWQFVARLRHRTCVRPQEGGDWIPNKQLHKRAKKTARDLGDWFVGKDRARSRVEARLVVARRTKCNRHRKGKRGKVLVGGISVSMRAQKAEPWLLATNCKLPAQNIISLYAKRMQIEETFRDTKSPQLGWSLVHSRSLCPKRLEVLLLIAALTYAQIILIGLAARANRVHRMLQANTTTKTTHSVFQLGLLVVTTDAGFTPTKKQLFSALTELQTLIRNSV